MSEDPRLLRAAKGALMTASACLLSPTRYDQRVPTGAVVHHVGPSLLDQLHAQVANSQNNRGTHSKSAPIPINPDALDLLAEIREWTGAGSRVDLRTAIRTLVRVAGQSTDCGDVSTLAGQLMEWVAAIESLLNPVARWHIAKPCPECGVRMTWRTTPAGEPVQTPALVVDAEHGCECRACGAVWLPAQLEQLAGVLGLTPLPGAVVSATNTGGPAELLTPWR